jgi:hypothetical protein
MNGADDREIAGVGTAPSSRRVKQHKGMLDVGGNITVLNARPQL